MAHALAALEELIGRNLKSAGRSILTRFGHFLDARKVLRGSISKQSRQGLDWLNFFLADIQTGFGAFVAFYLADLGWDKNQVGLASVGRHRRRLNCPCAGRSDRRLGTVETGSRRDRHYDDCGVRTDFGVRADIRAGLHRPILHGITSGIVTPAIAAISLGLVGRGAMSARTGRNNAFDAAGNALTAGAMGAAGQYISKSAIFLGAAALCIPALIALSFIRGEEIDYARARAMRGLARPPRIFSAFST